jgi:hypothetical protein
MDAERVHAGRTVSFIAAVHVADALAHTLGGGDPVEPDSGYLARLGVAAEWDGWLERFRADVAQWSAALVD